MTRREPLIVLVGVLGFGLLTAAYVIWTLEGRAVTDRAAVRRLADRDAANTQAQQELQRLVTALQGQVRKLGGSPLTRAPSPVATQPAAGPTYVVIPSAPTSPAGSSPRPTPAPTPRPTPTKSPTPTPTPSATCTVKAGPICLGQR